jgi:uncharacterized membrane protein
MRPERKLPAIIAMMLIGCGLLIIYVHLGWPQRFDRFLEPFLPWRIEVAVKLATIVLTIGAVILLIASTAGSKDRR